MDNRSCLAELEMDLKTVVVDGENAESLRPVNEGNKPGYMTSKAIALEAGIRTESPRYSGMHQHCQYSRTC